jgi:glycerol-3-phosphate acyltransferase PlsY
MGRGRWGWVAAAYLAGTFPSARVAARLAGLHELEGVEASTSEGDAHVLLGQQAGPVAAGAAMAADVAKAALVAAASKRAGLTPGWQAATGVAVVAGHAFPFHSREYAGRGLAAAAGATLVHLPGAMVVAGSILLAGKALGHTGAASTLGFATVPVVAAVQRRPRAFVAMGVGVFGVIMARRLQGLRPADGPRAVLRRAVFDSDEPS